MPESEKEGTLNNFFIDEELGYQYGASEVDMWEYIHASRICYFHLQSCLTIVTSGVSHLIVWGCKKCGEIPQRLKVLMTKLELRFSFLQFL